MLGHLVETAHIAGIMAAELGVEPTLVKRCAFLHDIGKALTHEVEGSHAIIGAELLRRYGESPRRWPTPSRRTTTRCSRAPSRRC